MQQLKFLFITFLVFLSIISLTACGEPATTVKGVVRDESGNAVQAVSVVLESNANASNTEFKKESEQKTGADGSFNFVTITAGASRARLIFEKDGFKRLEKEVKPNSENNLEIILERQLK